MYNTLKQITAIALCQFLCVASAWSNNRAKNVILFIGDGMGFEQVKAASLYAQGKENSLSFQQFPAQGQMTTYSANSEITDSGAGATAIATGRKVSNGVISTAIPGDQRPLTTVLEHFQEKGKSTGLVTTTTITHATPAAFAAHEPNRGNYHNIAQDYLTQTRPQILFGGGGAGISPQAATKAGYKVVTNRVEMEKLDTENIERVSGQFGQNHLPYEYDGLGKLPDLSEMTKTALNILDNDPDGLFLLVEAGRIDHAGHGNDIKRNVMETIEFSEAVAEAYNWAQKHPNTLIIVTADHETGGLKVKQNNGAGKFPTVSWSTDYHTSVNVPIYAWGVNSQQIKDTMDNTDLFTVIMGRNSP